MSQKAKLNEESSINFKCQELASEIVDYFAKEYKKNEFMMFGNKQFPVCVVRWTPNDDSKTFNGTISSATCTVVKMARTEYAKEENRYSLLDAYYNADYKIISVKIALVENEDGTEELMTKDCESVLSHELLHAYQKQFKILKGKKLYLLASSLMETARDENEYRIAVGLYYFSAKEINANANALYTELKNNNIDNRIRHRRNHISRIRH